MAMVLSPFNMTMVHPLQLQTSEALRVKQDFRGFRVKKATRETLVRKVKLGHRDPQDWMARMVQLVHKGQKVAQEILVHKDHKVKLGHREHKVKKELLVIPGHKVPRVIKVKMEKLDHRGLQDWTVSMVCKDRKVKLGHRDHRVKKVKMEKLDLRGRQD
jgi:hypothetical protein